MRNKLKTSLSAIACAGVLIIAGCGGGSGGTAVVQPAAVSVVLSGVAATGAPFTGGTVTVTDSTGASVGIPSGETTPKPAAIKADGTYSVTLTDTAKSPFVIVATRTNGDGQTESLVSVAASASSAVVNITPVTTLIAARLSPTGNPSNLASEVAANPASLLTAATLADKLAEVQSLLAPVLQASSSSAFNPLSSVFSANGSGYDLLLDSLKVTIIPASATSTNIEVAVRTVNTSSPVIQFNSAQPIAAVLSSNAVTATTINGSVALSAASLTPVGTSTQIADLLTRLQACYALPVTTRVNDSSASALSVNITAPECRTVFWANDPVNYKSNGSIVGKGRSFNGIFDSVANNLVWDQPSYEFTAANGDVVFGYRTTSNVGNINFDALTARLEPSTGKLKLIGNQYAYSGGVEPYQQFRQYPTLNQSTNNFHSTGYNFTVNNVLDSAGVTIFDRVEVATPFGDTYVLKPTAGSNSLRLQKGTSITGTSVIRLRGVYSSAATAANTAIASPAARETGLVFASPEKTDAQLTAIAAQSVWTMSYFLKTNTSSPVAVQTYRTRSRALSIAEYKLQPLAELAPAFLATTAADAVTSSTPGPIGRIQLPSTGNTGQIPWVVGAGAVPPTSMTLFGSRYSLASNNVYSRLLDFDDSVSFGSTVRSAAIDCVAASSSDTHCLSSPAGAFAPTAFASGLQLAARDKTGRVFANHYAIYFLP